MKKTIAILPARGGSKGIPLKNIYPINNKPMIGYSIDALKNSMVDEIYVSTDCNKIKSIVTSYQVKTIDRPSELSSDDSPTIDTVNHVINSLSLSNNIVIVLIQPTSPLIDSNDINNGIYTFNLGSFDTVISVTHSHDILWEEHNHKLIPKGHTPHNRIKRQDMKKTFTENGAFYITKVSTIKEYNSIFGNSVGYIEIPKSRSFQVDDYEDIKIVESLLND